MTPVDRRERLAVFVLAVLLAWVAAVLCFKTTVEFQHGAVLQVLNSHANLPWQHRLLSPFAVVGLMVLGNGAIDAAAAEHWFYLFTLAAAFYLFYFWLRDYFRPEFSLVCVLFLAVGFTVSWLLNIDLQHVPPYGVRYSYDATAVVINIGLAYAATNGRRWLWFVLLAIGIFNRESCIALAPALLLFASRNGGWKTTTAQFVLSLLVFAAIKGFLLWLYPGRAMEFKLWHNLSMLAGAYGAAPYRALIATFGGLLPFVAFGYRALPSDLKRLFLPVGIGVVSIFLWANIYEIRVFTDYAPFVIPAGVLGWRRCFAARGTLT